MSNKQEATYGPIPDGPGRWMTDAELARWVSPAAKRIGDGFLARAEAAEAEVERLRAEVAHWEHHAWEAGEGFKRAVEDAVRANARRRAAEARLRKVRAYVDDPGNWSALDGRRRLLLAWLDGKTPEVADFGTDDEEEL